MDEDGTWMESEIYMYVKEEMKTQEREREREIHGEEIR